MRKILHGVAFGLATVSLSVACGGGTKDSETTPAVATDPATPAAQVEEPVGPPHLKFTEMTISEGTNKIFKIHADGKTEIGSAGDAWSEGPAVTADGTITFKAQKVARVNPDGTMVNLRTNEVIPITVASDTLVVQTASGPLTFTMAPDGTIAVPGAPPEKSLKVEGAVDADARRTALSLIGAIFLAGKAEAPPADGAQPAEGAQPAAGAQPGPGAKSAAGAKPAPATKPQ